MHGQRRQTDGAACPYCGAIPSRFLRNGRRKHIFRTVEQGIVSQITGSLARWKCPVCRRSFTEYPEYAVRGKRFSRGTIQALCERYFRDGRTTYRETVCDDGIPIAYPESGRSVSGFDDDDAQTPALSHTTVYRWITTLGDQPSPDVSGEDPRPDYPDGTLEGVWSVGNKCRSAEREALLRRCWRALRSGRTRR